MSAYRIMMCVTVEGGFPETKHLPEEIQKVTALCFTTQEKRASVADNAKHARVNWHTASLYGMYHFVIISHMVFSINFVNFQSQLSSSGTV